MNYRIICNTPDDVEPGHVQTYSDYTLFDLTQEGRELNKAILTRGFNGNFQDAQLVFTIHPGHPCYDCIALSLSTITVYDEVNGDYVEIFRGRPISCSVDKVLMKTYTCEHMMKFLIDVPDIFSTIDDDGNVDIPTAINAVMTGYNQYAADNRKIIAPTVGITGKAQATAGASVYSNLSAWLKTAGYYAKITFSNDQYQLVFSQDTGVNSDDFSVVFGENVMDYLDTVNVDKLYTAVYPIGVDSSDESFNKITMDDATGITTETHYPINTTKKIIYNDTVSAEYGLVILYAEIDLKDESSKTAQTVYTKAVQALKNASGAKDAFAISAVDPRLVGMDGGIAYEGNYYKVVIPPFGLNTYQRLTKIVTNMTKPSGGSFTFGGERNLLTDQSAAATLAAGRASSAAADARKAATKKSLEYKDYIVETGTSGDWEYEKYKSGAVECRATSLAVSMGTWATWITDLIWSTGDINYPFTFANADDMDVDVTVTNKSGTTEVNGLILIAIKSTTKCQIRFVRKIAASTMYVNVRIRGKLATN